jgi:inner membrane protein
MEPVTHVLTGACLARAGFNRKAAYATLAMAVAAEFPDIDTLWSLDGPVAGFTHHRGITHTFLGLPFEAAIVVAAVYAIHRFRLRRQPGRPLNLAPVRWGLLYLFVCVALLSHLLLDFTNNYGLRPFFPFHPQWYAASIVFIFDPLLFAILVFGLVLPLIFGLVSSEIGSRRQPFRGRGLARTALVLVVLYWSVRFWEHHQALGLAGQQTLAVAAPLPAPSDSTAADAQDAPLPTPPPPSYLAPVRTLASPDPLSVFRWYTVTDFGPAYQLATVNTRALTVDPAQFTQPKAAQDAFTRAAMASPVGRAYLDWSPMPWITVAHPDRLESSGTPGDPATLVTFRDPRFMGETPILHSSSATPLTATVALDAGNHVVGQTMDGRAQR